MGASQSSPHHVEEPKRQSNRRLQVTRSCLRAGSVRPCAGPGDRSRSAPPWPLENYPVLEEVKLPHSRQRGNRP